MENAKIEKIIIGLITDLNSLRLKYLEDEKMLHRIDMLKSDLIFTNEVTIRVPKLNKQEKSKVLEIININREFISILKDNN